MNIRRILIAVGAVIVITVTLALAVRADSSRINILNQNKYQQFSDSLDVLADELSQVFADQQAAITELAEQIDVAALSTGSLAPPESQRLKQSVNQLLLRNPGVIDIRIVAGDSRRTLYSTIDSDIESLSDQSIKYRPLEEIVTPQVFQRLTAPAESSDAGGQTAVMVLPQTQRLVLIQTLAQAPESTEQQVVSLTYSSLDLIVLSLTTTPLRTMEIYPAGIIVNPLPSVDYSTLDAGRLQGGAGEIEIHEGDRLAVLSSVLPQGVPVYLFLSADELRADNFTIALLFFVVVCVLFVVILLILNILRKQNDVVTTRFSLFRKNLMRFIDERTALRDMALLSLLSSQRDKLITKITKGIRGSKETLENLFETEWKKLLGALQLAGYIHEERVQREFTADSAASAPPPSAAPAVARTASAPDIAPPAHDDVPLAEADELMDIDALDAEPLDAEPLSLDEIEEADAEPLPLDEIDEAAPLEEPASVDAIDAPTPAPAPPAPTAGTPAAPRARRPSLWRIAHAAANKTTPPQSPPPFAQRKRRPDAGLLVRADRMRRPGVFEDNGIYIIANTLVEQERQRSGSTDVDPEFLKLVETIS